MIGWKQLPTTDHGMNRRLNRTIRVQAPGGRRQWGGGYKAAGCKVGGIHPHPPLVSMGGLGGGGGGVTWLYPSSPSSPSWLQFWPPTFPDQRPSTNCLFSDLPQISWQPFLLDSDNSTQSQSPLHVLHVPYPPQRETGS